MVVLIPRGGVAVGAGGGAGLLGAVAQPRLRILGALHGVATQRSFWIPHFCLIVVNLKETVYSAYRGGRNAGSLRFSPVVSAAADRLLGVRCDRFVWFPGSWLQIAFAFDTRIYGYLYFSWGPGFLFHNSRANTRFFFVFEINRHATTTWGLVSVEVVASFSILILFEARATA